MNSAHILLVEDNEGDILLTREALEARKLIKKIDIAKNGVLAIDFLENILINEGNLLPDLILLDINLPKKNGQEVLQFIKTHDSLKQIPVIMLTTSSSDRDVIASYRNHANCYIMKPVDVDNFMEVITRIEDFWFTTVKLPRNIKQ
jgi:CheY-like chemotaxis protein